MFCGAGSGSDAFSDWEHHRYDATATWCMRTLFIA